VALAKSCRHENVAWLRNRPPSSEGELFSMHPVKNIFYRLCRGVGAGQTPLRTPRQRISGGPNSCSSDMQAASDEFPQGCRTKHCTQLIRGSAPMRRRSPHQEWKHTVAFTPCFKSHPCDKTHKLAVLNHIVAAGGRGWAASSMPWALQPARRLGNT
jgi:hypothetical protein